MNDMIGVMRLRAKKRNVVRRQMKWPTRGRGQRQGKLISSAQDSCESN